MPYILQKNSIPGVARWTQTSGGGGLNSIPTGNTIWVDASVGNDGTGTVDRLDLPFLTIAAAIAVATSGDVIMLRPGTYTESGLTLPSGVDLVGSGWGNTTIGTTGAQTDILTINNNVVEGFTVQVPTAAHAGIKHLSGTGGVYAINLAGDNGTGVGQGIYKSGSGKLVGGNIRCETGGLEVGLLVDSGVLAVDDVHFPNTSAAISRAVKGAGTGRFQAQAINMGNSQIGHGFHLEGTCTMLVYNPNIFNVSVAIHIAADGVSFTSTGGKIGGSTLTVSVDPALTGTGTTVEALATVIDPLFFFPPAAAGNVNYVLNFQQLKTNIREARQRIIGADLALGFPEKGSGLYVGRGAAYGDGMVVYTTDGTETMVGSVVTGGNQTEVTTAAQSLDASTFSFQGLAANNAIYFASIRRAPDGTQLKHWGGELSQVVAGVGGSYIIEIWDGAAWVSKETMSVGVDTGYVYGNSIFLRASSREDIRYELSSASTWGLATLNGITAYWSRIRIATAVTTAPTWERWQLTEDALHINGRGQISADGNAQWKQTIVGAGNVFASGGTTTDGTATVGTGQGAWTHDLDGSRLNQSGDVISTQFVIPAGVNTAFPIIFRLSYEYSQYNAAPTIEGRMLGVQREGVLVADPGGSLTPVARTEAATALLTSVPGLIDSQTPTSTTLGKVLSLNFGPYDISNLYSGDLVLFQISMTADGGGGGTATDIQVWAIEVEGVLYTTGQAT